MTRVLVLGTVPPGGGFRAEALRRIAADHLAMGDHVEVWSPSPRSAAHVHVARPGLGLARRLLVAAGRFDTLVLRVQSGLPFRGNETRVTRAAIFLLLGVVARRFDEVTVVLDTPISIPGGVGGWPTKELWSRARVVIETEDDRGHLAAIPWLDPARVSLVEPPVKPAATPVPEWPKPDAPELRSAVLDVVRRRAEVGRRLQQAGVEVAIAKVHAEAAEARLHPEGRRGHRDLAAAFEAGGEPIRVRRGAVVRRYGRRFLGRVRGRLVGRLRALLG